MIFLIPMGVLIFLIVIFTREKADYPLYSMLVGLGLVVFLSFFYPIGFGEVHDMIYFRPLYYLVSFQIVVQMVRENNILNYVAIQLIRFSKGNLRLLYYSVSIVATLCSTFIPGIMVVLVFGNFIIKTCKILEVQALPFLFTLGMCANIGSVLMPFGSAKNLIIAVEYGLDTLWFLQRMAPIFVILVASTLLWIDYKYLRPIYTDKEVTSRKIALLLQYLRPADVIKNKETFQKNVIALGILLVFLFLSPEPYIVSLFGALVFLILNKQNLNSRMKKLEWKLPLYLVALYLTIGALELTGGISIITTGISFLMDWLQGSDLLFFLLIVLIIGNFGAGILSPTTTTLIVLALLREWLIMFPFLGDSIDIILVALLLAVNLGSNFLPQSSSSNIGILELASINNISEVNYKSLMKVGIVCVLIHLLISLLYILILLIL